MTFAEMEAERDRLRVELNATLYDFSESTDRDAESRRKLEIEITRLRAQVAVLRDVLGPFAACTPENMVCAPGLEPGLSPGDFRRAAAALAATPADCEREIREDQKRRDAEVIQSLVIVSEGNTEINECFYGVQFCGHTLWSRGGQRSTVTSAARAVVRRIRGRIASAIKRGEEEEKR